MTGLHFDIAGDNSNFLRKLDEARNGVRSTSKQIKESGVSIEQMFGRLTNGVAAFGAGITAKEIVSSIIRVRGEFQQLEVAFNTMLGSEQKATSLMQQLVKTAATTPFDLQSVAKGAKQLLAYGTNAENVNDELITLGNVAAGISVPLGDLVYLYGTLRSQGRAYSVDIKQFAGRGIPIYAELAKVMGVNVEKVNALIEAGKVGFPQVEQAFKNMTSAGGMFNNLMQEQSKTITGQISNIGDSISMMYNNIGKSSEGMINDALSGVSYLVENYEQVGKTVIELAATYGTYKTAIIVLSAIEKARYTATLAMGASEKTLTTWQAIRFVATEKLTAAQKALNASMLKNPYILVGAAVAGLCYGVYKLITYQTDAEKAQSKLNDTVKEFNNQTASENAEINRLFDKLRNTSKETSNYQKTKDEIIKKYGSYLEGLNQEVSKLNDVEAAYRAISTAARQAAADRAITKATQEAQDDWAENRGNVIEKLKGSLTSGGKMTDGAAEAFIETINRELKETGRLSDETTKKIEKYNYTITHPETGEIIGSGNSILWAVDALKKNDKILDDLYGQINSKFGVNTNEYESLGKADIDAYIKGFESALSNFKKTGNKQTVQLKTGWVSFGSEEEINLQLNKLNEVKKSLNENLSLNSEKKAASKWLSSYKKAYDDAEKAYNDFLKSKQVMSEVDRDKELERLKGLRDKAKKTYEEKGGSASSDNKQESAVEKLRKEQEKYNLLLDQQKREQARMKTDSQHEIEQIEINGLAEGSEKVLRQRKLNHEKELEAIKREAQEKKAKAIEAARDAHESNPDKKKGIFDADKFVKSEPAQKQFAIFDKTAEAKTKTENTKYNRGDDFKGLLNEYQDYTDKRLAIETKYNNDLETLEDQRKIAIENGDAKQVEQIDRAKAQATANKGKELMGLDYDKLKESPEYVRAFENLKETSSETLNSLLSQLENAKSTAAKVLSPDQLREYTTTIQEIMDELDSRNPFQSLSDKKQELAEAEQELADAQLALENARQTADAVKGGAQIENGVKSSKFNEKTGKIDSSKAYLTEAQALEKVKEKTDKYNKAKDNVVKTDAKVKKAEKDVKGQIDELANAMSDLGNSIGGQAGEIISLIGDIGSFTMFAMEGVKAAADTSATAISTVEKASVILAIISAAVQVATKIAKLFKGESDEEKRKKELEHYNKIIAIYDKIIEKQKDSIKFGYGFASIEAAKKAMEGLNAQTEQYRNIARSNATNIMFKPENLTAYRKALADLGIQADLGDLFKTDELSNLSSKQLEYIRDNYKDLWASLRNEERDALQAIIDAEEKGKEITDEWKEAITGVSYDSFYNEFIDTLSDMDSSAEDMANNFGEYLKKSILAAMVAKEFQGKIDNLYEMWAAAGKEESDGGIDITKQEAEDLQKRQKELTEAMIKRREEMEKTYGWESSSSQDSTKSGFESMSQDTGNELNGRFTALQISNEEIKNSMLSMLTGVNLISTTTAANGITLMEIRNLAISSNSYLEDIAGFQKKIVTDFGQKLESIDGGIKRFNSR